ncbi:MAG TPA: hypothetical protein DCP71_02695 [Verrucomicrobiales bacterium]|nr:hypothetical protein [Verrucomicrobiales bacterium]
MAFDRIRYSGLAWPILTALAVRRELISYGSLAHQLGIHHRQCRLFLDNIQSHCLQKRLPPLTALIVGKYTGLPGHGFIAWDIEDAETAQNAVYDYDWSQTGNPFGFALKGESLDSLAERLLDRNPNLEPVYRLVEDRGIQQVIFRKALIKAYSRRCAMSVPQSEDLLEAAHILPYRECTPAERIDVRNGLLLSFVYHRLFDMDWLRIREDYRIIDGPELPRQTVDFEAALTLRFRRPHLYLPEDPRFSPSPDYIRRRYGI